MPRYSLQTDMEADIWKREKERKNDAVSEEKNRKIDRRRKQRDYEPKEKLVCPEGSWEEFEFSVHLKIFESSDSNYRYMLGRIQAIGKILA